MPKISYTCITERRDTSDHGLPHHFKGTGDGCKWLDRHKNCVGEVSLHCQLELDTLAFFKCPHRQKSEGLRSGERGGCNSKTDRAYIY